MKTRQPINPKSMNRWWTKKYRPRFLAPWRREPAELDKLHTRGSLERHLAGLRGHAAIYHCVSRVVDRRRVFGPAEKEQFAQFMRVYEKFCQVRVLTHCVMSNHFHILVEIPEAPTDRGKSWSDGQFLEHISCLYYDHFHRAIANELKDLRENGRDAEAEAFRARFFARMWDLSAFMHDLKLRFAKWFNREHERNGVLWSENFRSVLVESGHAARMVGSYIDLNPVRAGVVEDPADYRWSGYAEAVGGGRRAREGIRLLVFEQKAGQFGESFGAKQASGTWREIAAEYRRDLYMDGEESLRDEKMGRAGISPEKVAKVLARGGKLSEAEMLRHRMRHFTDGLVIGSESFVEGVFSLARGHFGENRKTGARRIRNVATSLCAMRDLRNAAKP